MLSDKRKALIKVLKDRRPDPDYALELENKLPETPAERDRLRDAYAAADSPSRSIVEHKSEL